MNRHPIGRAQVVAFLKGLVKSAIALRNPNGTFSLKPKEGRKWRRQQGLKESYRHGSPEPFPPPTPDEARDLLDDKELLAGFLAALNAASELPPGSATRPGT